MEILTTRFGPIPAEAHDQVEFPGGLVGLRQLKRFLTVRDPVASDLVWLQSMRDPAWALALISPRIVLPSYQIRATPEQLAPIRATDSRDVDVYAVLNRTNGTLTANLQAPILINRRLGLGLQLVLTDSQYDLRHAVVLGTTIRQSA